MLIQMCDRILVFKEGEIVEDGTYEELHSVDSKIEKLLQSQICLYTKEKN